MKSNIGLTKFKFSDLFTLEPVNYPRRKNRHPFSFYLKVKNKRIKGSTGRGIYFFAEKIAGHWRLVYVGIRADMDENGFHQERIKKHLVTDTFRLINIGPNGGKGHAAGFGYRTKKEIKRNDLPEILKEILFHGRTYQPENLTSDMKLIELIQENPYWWSWRFKALEGCPKPSEWEDYGEFNPTGIETSGKRFSYVCHNWDYFEDDSNITIGRFDENYQFYFMQFNDELFSDLDRSEAKNWLESIEDEIVLKFNPITNAKGDGNVMARISKWQKRKTDLSSLSREIYDFTIKVKNLRPSSK